MIYLWHSSCKAWKSLDPIFLVYTKKNTFACFRFEYFVCYSGSTFLGTLINPFQTHTFCIKIKPFKKFLLKKWPAALWCKANIRLEQTNTWVLPCFIGHLTLKQARRKQCVWPRELPTKYPTELIIYNFFSCRLLRYSGNLFQKHLRREYSAIFSFRT